MLPLGRKNARRCTECDITCHANCAHLVPDFCGMSMETANQLLRDWRDINKARGGRTTTMGGRTQASGLSHTQVQQPYSASPGFPGDQIAAGMDRMRLTGGEQPPPPPKTPDYYRQQQQPPIPGQQPMQQPPTGYPQQPARPSPGSRPPFPTEPVQPQAQRPGAGYEQGGDGYQVCVVVIRYFLYKPTWNWTLATGCSSNRTSENIPGSCTVPNAATASPTSCSRATA